jgi:hypothetical protein
MSTGTQEHFYALDVATGHGIEFEVDGKTWTFSPLTFRDGRTLMVHMRSEALKAYLLAVKDRGSGFVFEKEYTVTVNSILFGAAAQEAFGDPELRWLQAKLSVQKKHPDVTDADVDKFFEDETTVAAIISAINIMTSGPLSTDSIKDEGDGDKGANPTEVKDQSSTPTASATS